MTVELEKLFEKYINYIADEYGLKVPDLLPHITLKRIDRYCEVGELKWSWGVCYKNKEEIIVDENLDNKIIELVLAREAFNLCIPSSISHIEIAKDLGWAFALNITKDKKLQKEWIKIWNKIVGSIKVNHLLYWPSNFFYAAYVIKKDQFLKKLIFYFKWLEKENIKVSEENYVKLIKEMLGELGFKFSDTDIKIIDLLIKNPNITNKEIAEKINLSYQTVHKRVKKLKEIGVLHCDWYINYQKIGVNILNYHIDLLNKDDIIKETLKRNPFLYALTEYYDTLKSYDVTFLVPHHPHNFHLMNLLEKQLEEHCHNLIVFRPFCARYGWNFRLYDSKSHRWNFNPDVWLLTVNRMKDYADLIYPCPGKLPDMKKIVNIDKRDIEILYHVGVKGISSIRALRSILKINTNELIARISRLKKNGVLFKQVSLHFIGLTENLSVFLKMKKENVPLYFIAISQIPYRYSLAQYENNWFIIKGILFLPKGTAIKMMQYLYAFFSKYTEFIDIHFGRSPLSTLSPFNPSWWNEKRNCWKAYDEIMETY